MAFTNDIQLNKDIAPKEFSHFAKGMAEYMANWAAIEYSKQQLTFPIAVRNVLISTVCQLIDSRENGSLCLSIDNETAQCLQQSFILGDETAYMQKPLTLDQKNRLYLSRDFWFEIKFAEALIPLNQPATGLPDTKDLSILLNRLFSNNPTNGINWQKIAVALALCRRFLTISGGPGTGKTTITAFLLRILLEIDENHRILLAAPTGKAASRMMESLRKQTNILPESLINKLPEAQTVHRLLGISQDYGTPHFNKTRLLSVDTLIIDEASMLDMALASQLLQAIPSTARLILLGDKNQLSAVEAGAVFAALSDRCVFSKNCCEQLSQLTGYPSDIFPLHHENQDNHFVNNAVWLNKSYRFTDDSAIGQLAKCILDPMQHDRFLQLFSTYQELNWIEIATGQNIQYIAHHLRAAFNTYRKTIRQNPFNRKAIFKAFDAIRILCAVRNGPLGINSTNTVLSQWMSEDTFSYFTGRESLFIGKPLIVRKNNYATGLMNGDIGIVLPKLQGSSLTHFSDWVVCFPTNGDYTAFNDIALSQIGEHDTAFALTIHQSQGSEFDNVLIILPDEDSNLLTQELLYTGITRAKQQVTICGRKTIFKQALQRTSNRQSGLIDRLVV